MRWRLCSSYLCDFLSADISGDQWRNFTPGVTGVMHIGYGERVEREPMKGVWGRAPGGGSAAKPPEAERFWQNNVKICT